MNSSIRSDFLEINRSQSGALRQTAGASVRRLLALAGLCLSLGSASVMAAPDPAAQKLYNTYCGSCHGSTGMGDGKAAASLQPAPKPLHQAIKGKKDDALLKVLQDGQGQMPGWKNVLNNDQMKQILTYVKGFGADGK